MTENLDIVYLFGFSGLTANHLRRLLPILKSQIKHDTKLGLILIHDGVIGSSQKGKMPEVLNQLLTLPVSVYALLPDLLARGIEPKTVDSRIKCIEYDELVDILAGTPKVASWM